MKSNKIINDIVTKYYNLIFTEHDEEYYDKTFDYRKQLSIRLNNRIESSYIWHHNNDSKILTSYTGFDIYNLKPLAIYYTHVALSTTPDKSGIIENSEINIDQNQIMLYLFIEFGVSVDEGENIYWNAKASEQTNGFDSLLPLDIYEYITISNVDYKVNSIENNNFIPILLMFKENDSSITENITFVNLSNKSGNIENTSSYTNGESTTYTNILYGRGIDSKSNIIDIHCTYPDHNF